MSFDKNGNLFAAVNSGDYDHPEDLFWIRKGHHYGFPWVMGGVENPQQNLRWSPVIEENPLLNVESYAYQMNYFYNDPKFPKRPKGVKFTSGIKNLGPDANEYRNPKTGEVEDADTTGITLTTFTPHSSPVGLVFDNNFMRQTQLQYAYVLRHSASDIPGSLLAPFTHEGGDLLRLQFYYNKKINNYEIKTRRIVGGFKSPSDCVFRGRELFIVEFNDLAPGNLWKLTLPESLR